MLGALRLFEVIYPSITVAQTVEKPLRTGGRSGRIGVFRALVCPVDSSAPPPIVHIRTSIV